MKILQCRGVTAKFIGIVSVLTALLIAALALLMSSTAHKAQSEQAEVFVGRLKAEQQQEEQLLRQTLQQKGEALVDLLTQAAASLISGYDFETLDRLAQSVVSDPDVEYVVFHDIDGDVIAGSTARRGEVSVLTRRILVDEEAVGSLSMGLNFDAIQGSLAAVSARIESVVAETGESIRQAGASSLRWMSLYAGLGIALLCFVTHVCLVHYVIRPVKGIISSLDKEAAELFATSAEVSTASEQVGAAAAVQASSLQQTSASLQEIS